MMKNFRKLAKISLILVYLVIIAGAVVRMTGSGMGCPDWPKCFGYYIPPTDIETLEWQPERVFEKGQVIIRNEALQVARTDFTTAQQFNTANWELYTKHDYSTFNVWHTWIEYINRLVTVILGIPMLLLMLISFFLFKKDKVITYGTIATLVVLFIQALLGKIVVDTNLKTGMITVHMVIAFLLMAMLLFLIYRSKESHISYTFKNNTKKLIFLTSFITLGQVVLGTQVREYVDLQIDFLGEQAKNLWLIQPPIKFYVHRSFSVLIVLLNIYLAYRMKKEVPNYKKINWALLLIGLSVFTGILMYYLDFPFGTQPLHLVLASLLFGVQFYMALEALKMSKNHKSLYL